MIKLSQDQRAALDAIRRRLAGRGSREASLSGAAGTGKTTMIKAIIADQGRQVMLLAPTGTAANRLAEVTGHETVTIHRALYGRPHEVRGEGRRDELRFGAPKVPDGAGPGTLVIVDEASMVGEKMANELRGVLRQAGSDLLWVGDHHQLPPVNQKPGVNLANATAILDQVHRQAEGSDVLALATAVRRGEAPDWGSYDRAKVGCQVGTLEHAVNWANGSRGRVLATATNKHRKRLNKLTRKSRGLSGPLHVGEQLLCRHNQHALGIMNGEPFTVAGIEQHEGLSEVCGTDVLWVTATTGQRMLVVPETFDAYRPRMSDRRIFKAVFSKVEAEAPSLAADVERYAVQATYGYARTVHSLQGHQVKGLGFVSCPSFLWGDWLTPQEKNQMRYTAITRATDEFQAFVMSEEPNYRKPKNPYPTLKPPQLRAPAWDTNGRTQ